MYDHFRNETIDMIAAIESRGFIFGAALAYKLNIGFIPIRKPGKLPARKLSETYELEYGTDKVEIHRDAVKAGTKVLLVDDLLATGGTALAACKLLTRLKSEIIGVVFLVELSFLKGRDLLKGYDVFSLIKYEKE
jgi:adenine phosphoribosyltransferase